MTKDSNYYLNLLEPIIEKWSRECLGKPLSNSHRTSVYKNFAKYIGHYPSPNVSQWIVDITNPKIQHILDLAAGPHGVTILKIINLRVQDDQNKRTENNAQTD